MWDRSTLEDLSEVMIDASICGLGQAAPNPIRSVQKYFGHEIRSSRSAARDVPTEPVTPADTEQKGPT